MSKIFFTENRVIIDTEECWVAHLILKPALHIKIRIALKLLDYSALAGIYWVEDSDF